MKRKKIKTSLNFTFIRIKYIRRVKIEIGEIEDNLVELNEFENTIDIADCIVVGGNEDLE